MASEPYRHSDIERKWQERWAKDELYRADEDSKKEKKYVLDMFPYPSGEGLHVGHPKGYIATDIYSRFFRMKGFSVLHPMGWDAFGLPAENYALKNKVHPREAVEKNIARYKEQLSLIGLDYDWSREINTTDPAYYHWTQWIFLKMLEHGLAFQSDEPINWCPSCKTGLANEDLDGNLCERCGTPVEKKRLPQWVLKITDYADRMLADLDTLDWPEHIKEAQKNWIGRSEGAEIKFQVHTLANDVVINAASVTVFTTRPDTIYGATYLVLAPEHIEVQKMQPFIKNWEKVSAYVKESSAKTEIERGAEGREKTGVKLEGVMAVNPATKEEIPVYVADYVLGSYGTGAVMAVPAHDERDHAFAKKFGLPSKQVIQERFVREDGDDAVRPDLPFEKRSAAACIIKHWSEDKYLCTKWKSVHWRGFVTGGLDGEDIATAGKREIREETGFLHARFVKTIGDPICVQFYHVNKQVNRWAEFQGAYFELEDGDREDISEEEKAILDLEWVSREEVASFITPPDLQRIWQQFEEGERIYTGAGVLVNSGAFDDRDSEEAKWAIAEAAGGKKVVRYRLRDWVFSRQRYWGEPIPVIHCEKCGAVPVPYEDLPVTLPEVESYEPTGTGESPLAAIDEWVNTTCPKCKGPGKRETNTMPQWAGSSWYYLRFMDPKDGAQLVAEKKEKYWAPVDLYVGGQEHATRHLIYARFWHKFLYDISVVSTPEPFAHLVSVGLIQAEDGRKMSKRFGNVINPDDMVARYGADAFRTYEMFMGPFENAIAWNTDSIAGTARFIEKAWRLAEKVVDDPVPTLDRVLHETVKKIGEDIEAFKFNTAVSQMMIFLNAVEKEGAIGKEQWSIFVRLLAPFAPHVTEELWERLGETYSVHTAAWPSYDPALLTSATVTMGVQVNGKHRGAIELTAETSEAEALASARKIPAVETALGGSEPKRVIYVPGKILNIVV